MLLGKLSRSLFVVFSGLATGVPSVGYAQDAPAPPLLACADLARLADDYSHANGNPSGATAEQDVVIEVEGPVTTSDDRAVPPYLVLCGGTPRLACVMEAPLHGAPPGRRVRVTGRLAEGDARMLVLDPCGALPQ